MKRGVFAAAAAALLLGMAAQSVADDKTTLALKLAKGAAYDVELSTKVSQSTKLAKSEIMQNTATDLTATMAVTEASDAGVMTIRVTYKSLRMELESPTTKMSGDSIHSKLVSQADKICVAMVGQNFTMDIDALGSVKKIGGVKELIEGVATALASDGQSKAVVISQLTPMFSETSLAQQFAAGLRIFPDHAVAAGEKWTIKTPAGEGAIAVNSETTFTLRESNASAVIASETVLASPTDHKTTINGEIAVINLSGKGAGTIEVDSKTGMTLKSSSSSEIGGTLAVSSPDGKTSDTAHLTVKTSSTMNAKPAK